MRQHPDLTGWVEFAWGRPQPPMATSQLRNLIEVDAAAAISELRSITSEPRRAGWEDALDLISDTIREWPSGGLAVLDAASGTSAT